MAAHSIDIIFRLGLAIVLGGLVGLERQVEQKPAGLRTHMLVSLGAAIFVLTSINGMPGADFSRVVQGVTTGVGFLGAGEIVSRWSMTGLHPTPPVSERLQIQGLTSAAAIWVAAALGVAAGSGQWQVGIIGALLTLGVLWGVKKLERWLHLNL